MPTRRVSARLAATSLFAVFSCTAIDCVPASAQNSAPGSPQELRTIDRFVTHKSSVPANAGQLVGLHLREKVLAGVEADAASGRSRARVVLFIHGGFSPATVAYDLDYKDYSWMAYLARAGFDVFALTHTAYGASPKPMMDDPCNVDPPQQKLLIPHVLKEPCAPRYPYKLTSSQTEWDEVATVVNFIRELRGVDKVSMIGWSTGTPRIGGFAAKYPEQVDRIVFLAPAPFFDANDPPEAFPEPGAPTILQTRDRLEKERWLADVKCADQIDDDSVRDVMWKALMVEEGVGASWMPGGVMRAPNRMNYGWRSTVAKIKSPTLVLLGEFDNFERRQDAWKALAVEQKVFVKVACGSHYLQYEKNRKVLHEASKEWLADGTVIGRRQGTLSADANGKIQ
jgi:pimeloyl-ACP methyl ester carboxylesterase